VFAIAFLLCLFFPSIGRSQQGLARDSTKKAPAVHQRRPGFDLPDSLYISRDTLKADIDTIVQYDAKDSIVFDVPQKRMTLVNNATMRFESRELDAYTIVMDFKTNMLDAYSNDYDSVISSSLARRRRIIRDTARTKTRGAPILHDGAVPYEGEVILYDFKTRRGTVQLGTTEMEGGFYYGEKIKQVDNGILFVENGRFTTCDAPTPHYYFESPKMKVVMQDQVFAEPVFLYIADVPIFALPFGVFPNHSGGRRSGIIPPNYQTTGDRGYGLTHLGYFNVFSDYFDAAIRADIFTKGGYNVDLLTEYMHRYILGGPATVHVGSGLTRTNSVDPYTRNWLAQLQLPNLSLGYTSSLTANLNFQSSGYYRNNAQNVQDILRQNVNSFASYTTNWEDEGVSLSAQYSRSQDLELNTYSETSPSVTLNKTTFFPFAPPPDEATGKQTLLQTLGISASISATRQLNKTLNQFAADSARKFAGDTSYHTSELYGITYNPSISISPKLGYISFTPSFNYSGAVFINQIVSRTPVLHADSSVTFIDDVRPGFHNVGRYDVGVGLSTTLYGTANIGVLGIKAIRHTVLPSIGFSYHPDFSGQEYRQYVDPRTGQSVKYDIYQNNLNAGFSGTGKSASMNFGIGNDFEAKIEHEINKDSTSEEKVRLLNIGAGSSYDFTLQRLGSLSVSASSQIGTSFSVSGNAGYSFYPRNATGGDSTDHTLIILHQGIVRATSASFSLNGSLSSALTSQGENLDSLRRLVGVKTPEDERAMLLGGYFPGPFIDIPFRPTWNVGYGLSYTESYGSFSTTRNFSGSATITFSPTRNWSFSTSASYDFAGKSFLIPNLRVHRDLHCWEMNLDYRPTGIIRGFNFEIRIKADQLRDIKLTRAESTYGTF
jgi:hypothetical protein